MGLPTIPPRALLAFRVASLTFGIISIALSAASIQLLRRVPRPASGADNILILVANGFGLLTTLYRIATHRVQDSTRKRRVIPVTTETIVIIILLAGFIYGAVATSTGRDACSGLGRREVGDGDDQEGNAARGSGTACSLTKASTAFTAGNFFTFCASTYTVGKAIWDEKH